MALETALYVSRGTFWGKALLGKFYSFIFTFGLFPKQNRKNREKFRQDCQNCFPCVLEEILRVFLKTIRIFQKNPVCANLLVSISEKILSGWCKMHSDFSEQHFGENKVIRKSDSLILFLGQKISEILRLFSGMVLKAAVFVFGDHFSKKVFFWNRKYSGLWLMFLYFDLWPSFFNIVVKTAIYVSKKIQKFLNDFFQENFIVSPFFWFFPEKTENWSKIATELSMLHSKCPEMILFGIWAKKLRNFGR